MAKAKVVKAFDGVKDGEIYPHRFDAGETVEGRLAAVAVEQGWAEPIGRGRPAAEESKAKDGGAAPDAGAPVAAQ